MDYFNLLAFFVLRLLRVHISLKPQRCSLSTTPFTPTSALAYLEDRFLSFSIFFADPTTFPLHPAGPIFHSLLFSYRDVLQVIHCSYISPCFDVLRQRSCCRCSCSWRQREPGTKRCSTPIPGQALWQYKHRSKLRYFYCR